MAMISGDRHKPRIKAAGARLFAGGFTLLILALGFNALLTYGSLEKLYVVSLVSSYQVVGKDLQRKIEQSLRFGKSIQKFIGMNTLLEETRERLSARSDPHDAAPSASGEHQEGSRERVTVSVALPDATVLYSADEGLVGTSVPQKVWLPHDPPGSKAGRQVSADYVKSRHSYFITLPVRDRDKTWVATIVMGFGEGQVEALLRQMVSRDLKVVSIITACCTLLLVLTLKFLIPDKALRPVRRFSRFRLYAAFVIIVGSAQIFFSAFNMNDYRNYFLQITREQVQTLVLFLKQDVEYLFSKGIQIDRLVKMDVVMGEILAASPELDELTIYNRHEKPLYRANREGMTDFQKSSDLVEAMPETTSTETAAYRVGAELVGRGGAEGRIVGTISRRAITARIHEVLLDSATVLVISLLFLVEMLVLLLPFIERQMQGDESAAGRYQTMRPAAFLFLFGVDICISFLPLYMEHLYTPIAGLSKEIVIGLPISARMLTTGISILAAGAWCDRRGWHEPFVSGLMLAGVGFIYAWLAPDALHFIASQVLFGLGYGCSLMASQGFIIACTDETNRARGLSQLWAGVYAGSICGGAAGAMLAERIGYGPIFFLGALILFLIVPYTFVFMRGAIARPQREAGKAELPKVTKRQVLGFLSDRSLLSLILFSSLPTAIALVGFLNYFIPLYLNRIGTSQSNIGRVLMVYGICLIYVAPLISHHLDTRPGRKPFIVVSGILGGLAAVVFSFLEGLWGIAISVLLLGLSSSFGFASQSGYVLRLHVTEELGKGRALSIYSSTSRLGQVLGPITFGWLMTATGGNRGVTWFGLAYLVLTGFFLLVARHDGKTTA